VNVGTNYDTSKFAVESIRRWWLDMGKEKYPQSKKLNEYPLFCLNKKKFIFL